MDSSNLRAAVSERALPIVGHLALHRFDQRRQGRLGIGRNREIDRRVALEVLIVTFQIEIVGGNAD
jgi:hypothetical protein